MPNLPEKARITLNKLFGAPLLLTFNFMEDALAGAQIGDWLAGFYQEAVAGAVPTTREVNTSGGLTGGGDLGDDLILSLGGTADQVLSTGSLTWAGASGKNLALTASGAGTVSIDGAAAWSVGATTGLAGTLGRAGQVLNIPGLVNGLIMQTGTKVANLAAGSGPGDSVRWEQGGALISGGSGLAADVVGATTAYLSGPGQPTVSATQVVLGVVGHAGILRQLTASLRVAPGGSDTATFTVIRSTDQGATWSPTALTCTITGASKQATDNNLAHAEGVNQGDWVGIQVVSSAGTAAGPAASVESL